MTDKRILFGEFEFPVIHGLEYLMDEAKPATDYLFVNEPNERFSMYFEKDFPIYSVPKKSQEDYCLFEINTKGRKINFFCPNRKKNLNSVVWYFYVELFDDNGVKHELPGQVRLGVVPDLFSLTASSKPQFIEVLERVKLCKQSVIT